MSLMRPRGSTAIFRTNTVAHASIGPWRTIEPVGKTWQPIEVNIRTHMVGASCILGEGRITLLSRPTRERHRFSLQEGGSFWDPHLHCDLGPSPTLRHGASAVGQFSYLDSEEDNPYETDQSGIWHFQCGANIVALSSWYAIQWSQAISPVHLTSLDSFK